MQRLSVERPRGRSDKQRFEAKFVVNTETGCWEWVAGACGRYGSFYYPSYPGASGKCMISAHRAAIYLYEGTIVPDGMEILHSCDNTFCCNPAHLSIGTHQDNMDDMMAKRRYIAGGAKLTAEEVASVRRLRAEGWTVKAIAELYGMDRGHMSRLTRGQHGIHTKEKQ